MAQAQFHSPYIYQGKPSSTRNAGRKTRAQIVPKIDWLKSAAKHKVWWATRSWKMCAILEIVHALISANLLAMSVYASLSFPLLSHAARLLDQLISKFIPLGDGTPKYRQNRNWTSHCEREIQQHCTTNFKDSVTPDGQSSVSLANARRTPTKYTTRIGSTHLQSKHR